MRRTTQPIGAWNFELAGWIAAGGLGGGSLIIRPDGVDFTLLDPLWLAVGLFVLIPAAGAVQELVLARPSTHGHRCPPS